MPGLLTFGFSLNKEDALVDLLDLVAMLLILKVND
jgi:hypothetical protein